MVWILLAVHHDEASRRVAAKMPDLFFFCHRFGSGWIGGCAQSCGGGGCIIDSGAGWSHGAISFPKPKLRNAAAAANQHVTTHVSFPSARQCRGFLLTAGLACVILGSWCTVSTNVLSTVCLRPTRLVSLLSPFASLFVRVWPVALVGELSCDHLQHPSLHS